MKTAKEVLSNTLEVLSENIKFRTQMCDRWDDVDYVIVIESVLKSMEIFAQQFTPDRERVIEVLNKYSTTSLNAVKDMDVNFIIDPMDYHKLASELLSLPDEENIAKTETDTGKIVDMPEIRPAQNLMNALDKLDAYLDKKKSKPDSVPEDEKKECNCNPGQWINNNGICVVCGGIVKPNSVPEDEKKEDFTDNYDINVKLPKGKTVKYKLVPEPSKEEQAKVYPEETLKDAFIAGYNLCAKSTLAQADVINYNFDVFYGNWLNSIAKKGGKE